MLKKPTNRSVWVEWLCVVGFFVLLFQLGMNIYQDYGVSWDEPLQRKHGMVSVDYINKQYEKPFYPWSKRWEKLEDYRYPYYGVVFSMSAFAIELYYEIKDFKQQMELRHKMVFILFFLSTIALYFIIKARTGAWYWGLLGCVFMVCTPRIFGHAFFNVKDIVFLSFMLFASWSMIRMLKNDSIFNILTHAFFSALAINGRILGVIIPAFTIFFYLFLLVRNDKIAKLLDEGLVKIIVYLGVGFLLMVGMWPYLWEAPLHHFYESFVSLSKYEIYQNSVRYFNESIYDTPWHYTIGWMFVSVPIGIFVAGIIGTLWLTWRVLKSYFDISKDLDGNEISDLVMLSLFIGPLVAVIYANSVLYDGWRQMFFIYPPFVYLACLAIYTFKSWAKASKLLIFACIFSLLIPTVLSMIRNHPHQHCFFNILQQGDVHQRFEVDYWGLSYKKAIEKIIDHSSSTDTIAVFFSNPPGSFNLEMIDKEKQKKIKVVTALDEADFYLTILRGMKQRDQMNKREYPMVKLWSSINHDHYPILQIYDLRNE